MNVAVANSLIERISTVVEGLMKERTLLETKLFPVREYMASAFLQYYELIPQLVKKISKAVGVERAGAAGRRFASGLNQKSLFAVASGFLAGREMLLEAGEEINEEKTLDVLNFWEGCTRAYRGDGMLLNEESNGVLRIISGREVLDVYSRFFRPVCDDIRRLCASVHAYLFLLNCESRGGIFHHGLYPIDRGAVLFREFTHLNGDKHPWVECDLLPYTNLVVGLYLEDCGAYVDDFGTVKFEHADYWQYVKSTCVFTVKNGGIVPLDSVDIRNLLDAVPKAQHFLYSKYFKWGREERIRAGVHAYTDFSGCLNTLGLKNTINKPLRQLSLEGEKSSLSFLIDKKPVFSPIGG